MPKFNIIYERINEYLKRNLVWIVLFFFLMSIQNIWSFVKASLEGIRQFTHKNEIYDSQAIGVIVSSILAIGTIYLAITASKTAQNAKEISQKALESSRPILEIPKKGDKQFLITPNKVFTIKNIGLAEAVNVKCVAKGSDEDKIHLLDIKISFIGVNNQIEIQGLDSNFQSCILFYENLISGKQYVYGFNLIISEYLVASIGHNYGNSNSPIDFDYFEKVARLVAFEKFQDLDQLLKF